MVRRGESFPPIDKENELMRERMNALLIPIPKKVAPNVRGAIGIHNSQVESYMKSIWTSEGVSEETIQKLEYRRADLCREAGIDEVA